MKLLPVCDPRAVMADACEMNITNKTDGTEGSAGN
jgi:hypothetical protein